MSFGYDVGKEGVSLSNTKKYRLRFTFGQDKLFKKYFATFKIPFHQFTQHWRILEEGKKLGWGLPRK